MLLQNIGELSELYSKWMKKDGRELKTKKIQNTSKGKVRLVIILKEKKFLMKKFANCTCIKDFRLSYKGKLILFGICTD